MAKRLKRLDKRENRTLNLMSMAREERRLHREDNAMEFYFGRVLAERMMAAESRPPDVSMPERVRDVVATIPPHGNVLDLRPHINEMSEAELWSTVNACPQATHVLTSGWTWVTDKALRSLAVGLGERLELVDLSETQVTDEMVAVFASRLFALHTAKLAGCPLVGQSGLRALCANCNASLTAVDLSKCARVDSECLGWLGGTEGYPPRPCRKLASVSCAGCPRVGDKGLLSLGGGGCPNLKFVNMSDCPGITNRGLVGLTRGCTKLRVVTMAGLAGSLGDASLRALGKRCHELKSLNLARSGDFTDAGVKALAKGCAHLQALNLAGAVSVTELGLCALVERAKNLGTLNVTGCSEITVNGLRAAVEGNGYVTEARSYFGFYPKEGHVSMKLSDEQLLLETQAALEIQHTWKVLLKRLAARAELDRLRKNKAARKIQDAFNAHLLSEERRQARRQALEERKATELQRCWRGKAARQMVARRLAHSRWLESMAPLFKRVQTAWRGFWLRRNDVLVSRALVELYAARVREAKIASAVLLQARFRRFLARIRSTAWKELKLQRWRDRDLSARRIQQCARMYVAYRTMLLLLAERQRIEAIQNKAAARIQAAYRGLQGKYNAMMTKAEVERLNRLRNRRAVFAQAAYRGFRGREVAERLRLVKARDGRAATKIQAAFRASRVLVWQALKMNKTAMFVFRREELEVDEAGVAAHERNKRRILRANRDSASETEDEDADSDEEGWTEFFDDAMGQQAWFSAKRGETVYEEPPPPEHHKHDFEQSLVDLDVRVYWPNSEAWFRGSVARYNKTKRKHRIEYPDGDHEWLDMAKEQDRIQVEDPEHGGLLVDFVNFLPPPLAARKERAALKVRKQKADLERTEADQFWVCTGWDKAAKAMRFFNECTGALKFLAKDYDEWVLGRDMDGCTAWHRFQSEAKEGDESTRSILDADPRLVERGDSWDAKELKKKTLGDCSMGVYLCQSLMDEWYAAPQEGRKGGKGEEFLRNKIMARVVENSATGFFKLQQAVTVAKKIFTEKEFQAEVMCTTAVSVLGAYQALLDYGKEKQKEIAEKKKGLLKYADPSVEKPKYHCPDCRRPVPGNARYCGVCGATMPTKLEATPKAEILEDGTRRKA
eukprot:CAMPEP_0172602968 /NCGR_PEP_ID=MMETSP1068-20121228/23151_1 /TAXON_ID=35684 /ORGANISM="Pseudopedinella elastica, Strain CCMP716" /LENGTH=1126 /DNA_ID=CAMNT_0013404513 /DNA_START=56 /DNA_END=3436 /DNA_ORIENTATION=+